VLNYYRYMADLPHPVPAKGVYRTGLQGQGWPEHCPPIRAASAYGWDVINPFEMVFIRDDDGQWSLEETLEVHSDVDLRSGMTPHPQQNAWFWEKGQMSPHVISDHVYEQVKNQVKVSTFLYLKTEKDWMISIRPIPGLKRPWSTLEAIVEADWYWPAHPLHGVIELPTEPSIKKVIIEEGEPLFRLLPVQRSTFEAREMSDDQFNTYFESGQAWLKENGKKVGHDHVLLTGVYAKQQEAAEFKVYPNILPTSNDKDHE
jgi:hypothetical protein